MNTSELQKRHLLALKEKYKIAHYSTTESDDFLYLILRKANLGIHINSLEFQWLAKNKLSATVEAILSQQYQAEDQKRLENELLQLRTKYQIPDELAIPINSPVYSILWKLETGIIPTDSELNWLKANGLDRQISLIQDILAFSKLKVTYQATKQLNQVSNEPLYSILNKLDAGNELVNVEIEWLAEFGFKETLEIYEKQVNERKSELEFLTLKSRYQVDSHPDTSTASPLYAILKKLDEHKELTCIECVWLKNHNIKRLAAIDRQIKNKNLFEKLKKIYKATQYQNSDSADPLFLILKKLLAYEKKLHTISEKTSALLNTVDLQL